MKAPGSWSTNQKVRLAGVRTKVLYLKTNVTRWDSDPDLGETFMCEKDLI